MAKIDWEVTERAALHQVKEAEAALSAFLASPAEKLTELRGAEAAAEKVSKEAREAYYDVRRAASLTLGLMVKKTEAEADEPPPGSFAYSEAFKKRVAEEVGCTLAEAKDMPGVQSFHGERVSGPELYRRVLDLLIGRILDAHPSVAAANAKLKAASEAHQAAQEARRKMENDHATALQGPRHAQEALDRLRYERQAAEEKKRKKAGLSAAPPPPPDPRIVAAKAKLLALDQKHRDEWRYSTRSEPW